MQTGSVATAAGVGGGAFFVPLFNILLNFSERSSSCAHDCLHCKFPTLSYQHVCATSASLIFWLLCPRHTGGAHYLEVSLSR